jgi:hypothetical protein
MNPDDIKECETPSEVSLTAKDDYSNTDNSFYSNSVASIMTFEVEEINFSKETLNPEMGATTSTTSSELSAPPSVPTQLYDNELVTL